MAVDHSAEEQLQSSACSSVHRNELLLQFQAKEHHKLLSMKTKSCAFRGRSKGDWHTSAHTQTLEIGTDISNSITSVLKDYMVIEIYEDNSIR